MSFGEGKRRAFRDAVALPQAVPQLAGIGVRFRGQFAYVTEYRPELAQRARRLVPVAARAFRPGSHRRVMMSG